ncbi:MAG TPA: peptide ABC transporter substrate-binding protein [Candidatus Elarobacter sp.]|nr:peptide ABC transporter substrate-binding protein [Candidatus Elarobacter sp.]
MLAAVALMAGCTGREGAAGGTVVIGSALDPKTLFPPTADNVQARELTDLIFQRLADRGAALNTLGDSGFVPRLAQRWEWSPDSLRVTFHIDPRARWEDGRAVTARDVKFAYDVYADPGTGARERESLIATVDSITVGDSLTCTAWFRQRSPERFDVLVTTLVPLPERLLGRVRHDSLAASAFAAKPVSDGPFRLAKWDQAVRLELAPSATYAGRRPALDRVIWTFSPDVATRFKQLVAGETDFLENLSVDDAAAAARRPDLRVVTLGSYAYNFLQLNLRDGASARPHPLFGDRALRRALTMALDRQLLVHSVFGASGHVGIGPFVRAQWAADTTVAQLAFDRAGAARLLDSLGWRTGADGMRSRNGHPLAFTLIVPAAIATRLAVAVLIQEQLRLAGVKVAIEKLDLNAMIDRLKTHEFDAAMNGFTVTPSPGGVKQTWIGAAATGGGLNYGRYENRAFDAQIDSAGAAGSLATAKAHYRTASQIIVDDAPAIWLYEPPVLAGVNARVHMGDIRADAWWMGIPAWTVAAGKPLARDSAPARAP